MTAVGIVNLAHYGRFVVAAGPDADVIFIMDGEYGFTHIPNEPRSRAHAQGIRDGKQFLSRGEQLAIDRDRQPQRLAIKRARIYIKHEIYQSIIGRHVIVSSLPQFVAA